MFIMSHSVHNHCSVGRMSINLNAEDLDGEAKYSALQYKIVYILLRQNFLFPLTLLLFSAYIKREMVECFLKNKNKTTWNGLNYIRIHCYIVEMRVFVENCSEEKADCSIKMKIQDTSLWLE